MFFISACSDPAMFVFSTIFDRAAASVWLGCGMLLLYWFVVVEVKCVGVGAAAAAAAAAAPVRERVLHGCGVLCALRASAPAK